MAIVKGCWPVGGYTPGSHDVNCSTCYKQFKGDKRATQCPECLIQDMFHLILNLQVAASIQPGGARVVLNLIKGSDYGQVKSDRSAESGADYEAGASDGDASGGNRCRISDLELSMMQTLQALKPLVEKRNQEFVKAVIALGEAVRKLEKQNGQ